MVECMVYWGRVEDGDVLILIVEVDEFCLLG